MSPRQPLYPIQTSPSPRTSNFPSSSSTSSEQSLPPQPSSPHSPSKKATRRGTLTRKILHAPPPQLIHQQHPAQPSSAPPYLSLALVHHDLTPAIRLVFTNILNTALTGYKTIFPLQSTTTTTPTISIPSLLAHELHIQATRAKAALFRLDATIPESLLAHLASAVALFLHLTRCENVVRMWLKWDEMARHAFRGLARTVLVLEDWRMFVIAGGEWKPGEVVRM